MRKLSVAVAFAALAFSLTGCVGFTVNPQPGPIPKAANPSSLRVAMASQNVPWELVGLGMNAQTLERVRQYPSCQPLIAQLDGVPSTIAQALKDSGAFGGVDLVNNLGFNGTDEGDHDLLIDAKFTGKYVQDPAQFPKAFLTGFLLFLPAPVVRYDDAFTANAELTVYDSAGRLVHKYNETGQVGTDAALFSAGMPSQLTGGVTAAISTLAAKVAGDILNDLPNLEEEAQEARTGERPRLRRRAASAPTVAAASAEPAAVSSYNAASEAQPEPEAPRVKHPAPVTQAQADAELLP